MERAAVRQSGCWICGVTEEVYVLCGKAVTAMWVFPQIYVVPEDGPFVLKYVVKNPLYINPLNPKLNPICYLLALLAHHVLHVSRISVKSLTLRLLMSYIYGAPILDVSRSYTTTHHSR